MSLENKWYVPISEKEVILISRDNQAGYQNTLVILDASGSMSRYFNVLLDVARTAMDAGCFTIWFSTGAKMYTALNENDPVDWTVALKRSNAWSQLTCYDSALKLAAEAVTPGCPVLFFSDGEPNGADYGNDLRKLQQIATDGAGFLQALYLGQNPGPTQLAILRELCTPGREPILIDGKDLETELRQFFTNTISVQTDSNSGAVSVGEYRATRLHRDELVSGAVNLLEQAKTDIPFMCGSVTAVLYFIQRTVVSMNARMLYRLVSDLNKWMSGVSRRDQEACYSVAKLIHMGHELAASTLREQQSTSALTDILNAGKVLSFTSPMLLSQIDALVKTAVVCMANNPSKSVKHAFVARSKLKAKTQYLADLVKRIVEKHGLAIIELVNSGKCKCVSVHANDALLMEIESLSNGSTSGVESAVVAVKNPSMIDIHFGSEWYPTSFETQQKQPSLILTPCLMSGDFVKLAAANTVGIHTGMSPLMLINGVWNLQLHNPLTWLLADEVINQILAYCRGSANPFNIWPSKRAYPYGFGFTAEAKYVQMPSPKAAIMAPLLQTSPSSIISTAVNDEREIWVRCVMPLVHSLKGEPWKEISGMVARTMTVDFNCQSSKIISDIIDGVILDKAQYIKLAVVPHIDTSIGLKDEMRLALDRFLGQVKNPLIGIASPLPANRESLEAMFRYVTRDAKGDISRLYVYLVEAVARIASVSAFNATHPELDAILTATNMTGLQTGFSFVPSAGMFRERIREYARLAILPVGNLSHLLLVLGALDLPIPIPEELHEYIPLTGQQATTLLAHFPDKGDFIMHSTSLTTVSRALVSNWKIEWCEHMIRHLSTAPTSMQMDVDAIAACLEKLSSESVLASRFMCSLSCDIMVKIIRAMQTRVAFATKKMSQYLCRLKLTDEDLLDKFIYVPGYCFSTQERYLQVLKDGTKFDMAQAIRSKGNSCGETLLNFISDFYSHLPVTLEMRQIINQWITVIGTPLNAEAAWAHFTMRGRSHSLVSGHAWIRKKLLTDPDNGTKTCLAKLIDLAKLRAAVLSDHGETLGGRMQLHTNALEVICHCLATGSTTTIPTTYIPVR